MGCTGCWSHAYSWSQPRRGLWFMRVNYPETCLLPAGRGPCGEWVGTRENSLQSVSKTRAWGQPIGFAPEFLHSSGTRSVQSSMKALAPTPCSHAKSPMGETAAGVGQTHSNSHSWAVNVRNITPPQGPATQLVSLWRETCCNEGDICAETRCFSMCSVFLPTYFHDMSGVWSDYLIFLLSLTAGISGSGVHSFTA